MTTVAQLLQESGFSGLAAGVPFAPETAVSAWQALCHQRAPKLERRPHNHTVMRPRVKGARRHCSSCRCHHLVLLLAAAAAPLRFAGADNSIADSLGRTDRSPHGLVVDVGTSFVPSNAPLFHTANHHSVAHVVLPRSSEWRKVLAHPSARHGLCAFVSSIATLPVRRAGVSVQGAWWLCCENGGSASLPARQVACARETSSNGVAELLGMVCIRPRQRRADDCGRRVALLFYAREACSNAGWCVATRTGWRFQPTLLQPIPTTPPPPTCDLNPLTNQLHSLTHSRRRAAAVPSTSAPHTRPATPLKWRARIWGRRGAGASWRLNAAALLKRRSAAPRSMVPGVRIVYGGSAKCLFCLSTGSVEARWLVAGFG